jgi:hydrogenase maturation protein HypF
MHRRAIAVSGIVQGVGFRPFIYDLATRLGLNGFVRNQTGGVMIEVEGETQSLDRFLNELSTKPPPLARIDEICWESRFPRGEPRFLIERSQVESGSPVFVSPDVAPCDDCLRELFDPRDRRFRYPFLNCTNCGPRLTIVQGVPYDRERTTMAQFAMCRLCRAEYEDPRNRRFHAQPTACWSCGPRLQLLDGLGRSVRCEDPLSNAIEALRLGKIVAIKGLGGYHLACIAGDERAVSELRLRKHRDEKPLAIMVRDLQGARALCEIAPAEEELLASATRPIVLLRRRRGNAVAEGVAPRNPRLGVMLPYTPLHHLLMHDLGETALVMTSGNQSDEPIAYGDQDALERLSGIADVFLVHDRPIHLRCDDSVTRVVAGQELPLRRSRGYAPMPLGLPLTCRVPTLALGGQLKATFALGRGRHAILSHHIGDLDHYEAYVAYLEAIDHYERLFAVRPELIVHDLHPDYASTRYACQRGNAIPRLEVQHHHAHVASCMADNRLDEPVIGVAFDGTGYGTDGAIWGGEFFTGDYTGFRRAAYLRYVSMPGGEQAIREPWRMAAAYLLDAGQGDALLGGRVSDQALSIVRWQLERRLNAPLTSSAGRIFDGVAALVGLCQKVSYEGQAAMELEWMASDLSACGAYPFELLETSEEASPILIDTRPIIVEIAEDVRRGCAAARIARRFHSTLVEIVAQVCVRLRALTLLNVVTVSGGVFQNALFTSELGVRLRREGFRVYSHRRVPPGDGGLSLGQLAIAAASDEAAAEPWHSNQRVRCP